jgi:hypothetical protein
MSAYGADFAILHLKIVEGEGMVYAPGSRATRGITVEATDETGQPVRGVAVSFQLPENGPSGEFISGSRTEIATTKDDGRTGVWGMRWNKVPGTLTIRITAAKDGVRAGITCTQVLDASVPAATAKVTRGGHSKLLMVALIAAGAAGAGLAAGSMHGSKTSSATPAQTLSIGTPTVIIGGPK